MSMVKTFTSDALTVRIQSSLETLAKEVALLVSGHLKEVIAKEGQARVILATGNSQIRFLDELIALGGVDWSRCTLFHMDEYLGISSTHQASFGYYMKTRME